MKLKTAAFLIFSQLIFTSAIGQLVLGGDITWQCLNSGSNTGKYIFKLTLFNQCDSGQLGSSQNLEVINGPVSSIALVKISEVQINPDCYDSSQQMTCTSSSPGVMSMAVYESAPIALNGVPGSTGWIFTWKTSFRQLDSSNIASGSGMTLRSAMYSVNSANAHPCMDNSPMFIESPMTMACYGYLTTMTQRAYDPDGDVLGYSFDNPLQTYSSWPATPVTWETGFSNSMPFPGTTFNSNNIDVTLSAAEGDMTYQILSTPNFRSYYVIKVQSERNGNVMAEVYREMVMHHKDCPPSPGFPPIQNGPPTLNFKLTQSGPALPGPNTSFSVVAGDTVRFFVDVNDMQFLPGLISGQTIRLIPRGSQFGTAFQNTSGGCNQPPCATLNTTNGMFNSSQKWFEGVFGTETDFTWVTDSLHGSATGERYQFHFYIQDDWCPVPGMQEHTVTVTVYDAPENHIEGTVYLDINGNGIQDGGENGMENILVKQSPSNFYINTNSSGDYSLGAYQGAHTVSIPSVPKYYQITAPVGGQYSLTISGSGTTYSGNDFGIQPIPNVNDLEVDVSSSSFHRPGWQVQYWINYYNAGTTTLSGNVDFNFNGPLSYLSATPSASTTSSGMASWNFTNLAPGQGGSIQAVLRIDSTAAVQDSVITFVTINPFSADTTPANNMDSLLRLVTASYDPNLKESRPALEYPGGVVLLSDVNNGLDIEYTIHFQNTGADTAFDVRVEDDINQTLDIESFQFIGASHPVYHEVRGRTIIWYFDDINLPDSATDFNGSTGFVKFRMFANNGLHVGDTVENTANIYFDLNAPISTTAKNGIVAMVDGVEELALSGYSINIYPNPSSAVFNVDVSDLREESLTYEVYSISGSLQLNGTIQQKNDHSGKDVLDMTGHPQGIYFVRFSGASQVVTKKVVLR